MTILLAQLGDIHFKGDSDPVLARAPQLGAAISAELSADVTTVVLALCGDTAFSGTKQQFQIARGFV